MTWGVINTQNYHLKIIYSLGIRAILFVKTRIGECWSLCILFMDGQLLFLHATDLDRPSNQLEIKTELAILRKSGHNIEL